MVPGFTCYTSPLSSLFYIQYLSAAFDNGVSFNIHYYYIHHVHTSIFQWVFFLSTWHGQVSTCLAANIHLWVNFYIAIPPAHDKAVSLLRYALSTIDAWFQLCHQSASHSAHPSQCKPCQVLNRYAQQMWSLTSNAEAVSRCQLLKWLLTSLCLLVHRL